MPRLPQPGADQGQWGNILNDYLSHHHDTDGTLKANTVTTSSIRDAAITAIKLAATARTIIDSTAGTNSGDQTLSISTRNLTISGANGNTVAVPSAEDPSPTTWGSITGTLADQSDVQAALDSKLSAPYIEAISEGAAPGFVITGSVVAIATQLFVSLSPSGGATSGSAVTMSATVTPVVAPGAVQFFAAGVAIGDAINVANGTATINTNELAMGTHTISAVFTPHNAAHYLSSTSNAVSYVITAPEPEPDFAVTVETVTETTAKIAWTNIPSAATAIRVTRDAGGGESGPWSTEVTPTTTEHTFLFLTAGATYTFTAQPLPGGTPVQVTATLPASDPQAVTTTTALVVSPAVSATAGATVTLTATVTPASAAGSVQFRDGGTNIGAAATVSGGTATRTTTTLAAGSRSLTAVFTPATPAAYTTSTSPITAYTINPAPSAPPAPTNLTAGTVTQTSVVLSWTAAAGATGYQVYRGSTQVATPNSSPYTATGLSAGTSYTFTVRATNAVGASGNSNAINVTTQAAPGSNTISLSSSTLTAPTFPVRIDTADNRNFIDAAGKRYYGIADTGWAAMNKLTKAQFTQYAEKRRSQGYTMLFMSVLRLESRSDAGNNRDDPQVATGRRPFTNMSNLSTADTSGSNTYWDHIEWCVDECRRLGLVAVLVGAWYGYDGSAWRSRVASSTSNAAAYGTFLGNLLGDRTNVWWLMGGDAAPGSAEAATNAMANALKAAANNNAHQLMTYHPQRYQQANSWFGSQSWYNMHAAYSGSSPAGSTNTNAGPVVQTEYQRGTVRPVISVENYYDMRQQTGRSAPHFSRTEIRNQVWQAALAGAFAAAHGNEYVWSFVSGWNGSNGINAPSAESDIRVLSRVMNTYIGKRFAADHSSNIITSGRGSGVDIAHGIRSSDNTVGIVYIPQNSRNITINLSLFTGAKSLAWVNPQTGAVNQFATNITANSHTVTSPSSTGDAVLIIQSAA